MTTVALSSSSLTMRCCASGIHKRVSPRSRNPLENPLEDPAIFVYGSLLSGFPQHALSFLELRELPSLRERGFCSHTLRRGYPGMFPEPPLSTR